MDEQFLFKEFKLQGNDMKSYNLTIYQGRNSLLFQIESRINGSNEII